MKKSGLDGVDVRRLDVELERGEGFDGDRGFGRGREEESGSKETCEEVGYGVGAGFGLEKIEMRWKVSLLSRKGR